MTHNLWVLKIRFGLGLGKILIFRFKVADGLNVTLGFEMLSNLSIGGPMVGPAVGLRIPGRYELMNVCPVAVILLAHVIPKLDVGLLLAIKRCLKSF